MTDLEQRIVKRLIRTGEQYRKAGLDSWLSMTVCPCCGRGEEVTRYRPLDINPMVWLGAASGGGLIMNVKYEPPHHTDACDSACDDIDGGFARMQHDRPPTEQELDDFVLGLFGDGGLPL